MKKILIVVDMQNDFIDGVLGCANAQAIVVPIADKIKAYREQDYEIMFTRDVHCADYLNTQEGRKLPIEHCLAGQEGCEIVPELAQHQQATDPVLDKSGFGNMEIADYLHRGQYQKVEVCGLVTNICVLFIAVLAKAALPEAEIIVDRQCVASYDDALHEKTLDVLAGMQVTVKG